ncbi:MAG TPA: chromosome partition protein MukE [Salinimicrobium sp.]|nr:chromosome partition protein MukE [Salinimicrobium sp.]
MEYENTPSNVEYSFKFLENKDLKEKFADLNIQLLSGRHIQKDSNYYLYQLLKKYFKELKYYYENFYGLELERDFKDDITFYYLDFIEQSRGVLSSSRRHKELSSLQTVTGIMLLNMYYDRYFENIKEITFQDIKKEILSGENSNQFKKLWFKDIRDEYSPKEWVRVVTNIKNTIKDFEKLGWIESMAKDDGEDIHFILKESIYRFQKLYEKEITSIDEFIENYSLQTND